MKLWIASTLISLAACQVGGPSPGEALDSDGDGLTDQDEELLGTDPMDSDSDDDGLSDREEHVLGTDPLNPDSDDDGLSDGSEHAIGTDPLNVDSDGDGQSDYMEQQHGTNPLDPESMFDTDSDDDGLSDVAENDLGTDPFNPDSDDDGYSDGAELSAGTDPLDAASVVYTGGWPYQANKDNMESVTIASAHNEQGELFPRVELMDQFGDAVDLYDFAGHGKPIMIEICPSWVGPCNNLASWLSGQADPAGWENVYPEVDDAVESDHAYWVHILMEDAGGNEPNLEDLEHWYQQYPNDNIPILADEQRELGTTYAHWYPYWILLNDDMTILSTAGSNSNIYTAPMSALQNLLHANDE